KNIIFLTYQCHVAGFLECLTFYGSSFNFVNIYAHWLWYAIQLTIPSLFNILGFKYFLPPAVVNLERFQSGNTTHLGFELCLVRIKGVWHIHYRFFYPNIYRVCSLTTMFGTSSYKVTGINGSGQFRISNFGIAQACIREPFEEAGISQWGKLIYFALIDVYEIRQLHGSTRVYGNHHGLRIGTTFLTGSNKGVKGACMRCCFRTRAICIVKVSRRTPLIGMCTGSDDVYCLGRTNTGIGYRHLQEIARVYDNVYGIF